MAGNFRGVLIFVIYVVGSAVTKITTHENNAYVYALAHKATGGVADRITSRPRSIKHSGVDGANDE